MQQCIALVLTIPKHFEKLDKIMYAQLASRLIEPSVYIIRSRVHR